MSPLYGIAKIKKSKLKSFQKEINALRSGLLGDKTIDEWKGLTDSERKLKITVFLCMTMVPEKDLKRIAKIINPWWEPYQKVARILIAMLTLFLTYQTITLFLAKKVYPKVFEHDVAFADGSVKKYGLFDGSSMVYKDSDSGAVLLDAGIIDWLLMRSKTTRYDSTKWTSDKELNEELKYFYGDFKDNVSMSGELNKVPLPIEGIYQAAINISGVRKIKMDIFVPQGLSNQYSPFLFFSQISVPAFFLSATDGKNYWNIKIYFENNVIESAEQIVFSPLSLSQNKNKVIWDKDPNLVFPGLKILFKDSTIQLSRNYILKYPDRSFAE
jgi:hypothetical protein